MEHHTAAWARRAIRLFQITVHPGSLASKIPSHDDDARMNLSLHLESPTPGKYRLQWASLLGRSYICIDQLDLLNTKAFNKWVTAILEPTKDTSGLQSDQYQEYLGLLQTMTTSTSRVCIIGSDAGLQLWCCGLRKECDFLAQWCSHTIILKQKPKNTKKMS
jgi:hypothetical protein